MFTTLFQTPCSIPTSYLYVFLTSYFAVILSLTSVTLVSKHSGKFIRLKTNTYVGRGKKALLFLSHLHRDRAAESSYDSPRSLCAQTAQQSQEKTVKS